MRNRSPVSSPSSVSTGAPLTPEPPMSMPRTTCCCATAAIVAHAGILPGVSFAIGQVVDHYRLDRGRRRVAGGHRVRGLRPATAAARRAEGAGRRAGRRTTRSAPASPSMRRGRRAARPPGHRQRVRLQRARRLAVLRHQVRRRRVPRPSCCKSRPATDRRGDDLPRAGRRGARLRPPPRRGARRRRARRSVLHGHVRGGRTRPCCSTSASPSRRRRRRAASRGRMVRAGRRGVLAGIEPAPTRRPARRSGRPGPDGVRAAHPAGAAGRAGRARRCSHRQLPAAIDDVFAEVLGVDGHGHDVHAVRRRAAPGAAARGAGVPTGAGRRAARCRRRSPSSRSSGRGVCGRRCARRRGGNVVAAHRRPCWPRSRRCRARGRRPRVVPRIAVRSTPAGGRGEPRRRRRSPPRPRAVRPSPTDDRRAADHRRAGADARPRRRRRRRRRPPADRRRPRWPRPTGRRRRPRR